MKTTTKKKGTRRHTPPAAAPEEQAISERERSNREYRQLEASWNNRVKAGRPVPRSLAAEVHEQLDAVLKSGYRDSALSAIMTVGLLHRLTRSREEANAR